MRSRKRTATAEAERDAVVDSLFDGVLRSAKSHLCATDAPLAAEVWASALAAVWDGGGAGVDGTAFGEALVRYAEADGTPEAIATLLALAAVAPPRLATRARTAASVLERDGVPAPAWADGAGRARATEGWVGHDTYGDQEIVIVGYAYPGGDEHCLCVLVDHNLGGVAKDAYPAAALSITLERWQEAESAGIRLAPAPLADVAGRLTGALRAADHHPDTAAAGRLAEMRALLDARLACLPAPEDTGVRHLDGEAREALVAEFLSSPEAAGLLAEPAVVPVCHGLVAYRCDHGDGDPLRWSPTVAGLCLLDHFPRQVGAPGGLDGPDLALLPDVLDAWVRFAGRRRGLQREALERLAGAVGSCREQFASTISMMLERGGDGEVDLAGEEAVHPLTPGGVTRP